MTEETPKHFRRIKSFVLRASRMTDGQKEAFDRHWTEKGLTVADGMQDFTEVYGRTAPVVLEIGFGMGQSLIDMGKARPDLDYLGVEVHMPGVGRILRDAEAESINNLRVYKEDAIEVLHQCIPDGSLERVQLFFPDPWHKKKHQKRRIVQPDFVQLLRKKLKPGGCFHMATDWENYAEHMMEVMSAAEGFSNEGGAGKYVPRPEFRPMTKFEKRGERLGHGVWDLIFVKNSPEL